MFVQGLSGIAKDLSKMSAKSAVKVLSPDDNQRLFRWVATLTGSKNAVKGLGFSLGFCLNFLVLFLYYMEWRSCFFLYFFIVNFNFK